MRKIGIDEAIEAIIATPVMTNIDPRYDWVSAEALREFIKVLTAEGYRALEILARPFEAAAALIERLNEWPEREQIVLGFGTMKTKQEAEAALALQPDFFVSAVFSPGVFEVAVRENIAYMPAVCTLQDVQNVLDAFEAAGRKVKALKICPVNMIGMDCVVMMTNIYPGIIYCPTGTVTVDNLREWKAIEGIGPPMQSEFVPAAMLGAGDWEAVRQRLAWLKGLCG